MGDEEEQGGGVANREAIAAALGKGWPPNREDIRKLEERWLLKLLAITAAY